MNKVWKKKWITALRSGKYEQSRGALKEENTYCCLGVIRAIAFPNSLAMRKNDYGGPVNYLCDTHLKKLGIDNETQIILANKNDKQLWSFARIATWIEENL